MAMPDHLGAFWRPARLLPWKRAMWKSFISDFMNSNDHKIVPWMPAPLGVFRVSSPHPQIDTALRDEFGWDGNYPP